MISALYRYRRNDPPHRNGIVAARRIDRGSAGPAPGPSPPLQLPRLSHPTRGRSACRALSLSASAGPGLIITLSASLYHRPHSLPRRDAPKAGFRAGRPECRVRGCADSDALPMESRYPVKRCFFGRQPRSILYLRSAVRMGAGHSSRSTAGPANFSSNELR